ncbi:hypothetical protein ACLB2K_019472 [Fragaria x ananassa]
MGRGTEKLRPVRPVPSRVKYKSFTLLQFQCLDKVARTLNPNPTLSVSLFLLELLHRPIPLASAPDSSSPPHLTARFLLTASSSPTSSSPPHLTARFLR